MSPQWYRRPQVLVALAVFVLTLGVYSQTLAPTISFWDCGEFITTSHIVGVPHQPGTPLYVLVGRVFDILLGSGDIETASMRTAWAVNFMSAFFSALAVMFVYLIIWELGRRADPDSGWIPHIGGVVGALFLAFSETFWNNAIEAEVYGLAAFMLALLTWLAIHWYDNRSLKSSDQLLLLMVYLLGLGVGFHLGTLLVYPGIFLLVIFASRRHLHWYDLLLISAGLAIFLFSTATRFNGLILFLLAFLLVLAAMRSLSGRHFVMLGSLLFVLGLSVHIIMMIRAGANPEPAINQTHPDDFSTLMSVIRREQYPPINPLSRRAPLLWQFGYYYNFLFNQFYFLGPGHGFLTVVSTVLGPIFLALLGMVHGLRRLFPLILIPLVNYFINGDILTFYLNFTDNEVRERDYFYFAAFLFLAIFIGLGASALLRAFAGQEGKSAEQLEKEKIDWRRGVQRIAIKPATKIVAALLLVIALLPITPGHTKFFEHDRSENRIAYEYAWNILAGLDENSILFTNGDNDTFPIWYLQEVEKFRTDVTVVNLSLINLKWYIKQLKHADKPLAMSLSDAAINSLQHTVYRDPNTGQETLVMIKDRVVHDLLVTNRKTGGDRPVFFAVTIPQENMVRYYSMLEMEGMAFRLMDRESTDKLPSTNPQKVLQNMLGLYAMDALTDGDTQGRRAQFAAMAGLSSDQDVVAMASFTDPGNMIDLAVLKDGLGVSRRDVFRNTNALHLLGNYPAALNRAGFEFYLAASQVAREDTVAYYRNLENALTSFEASLAIQPFNDQAVELYPLLLVQAFRDQDAKDFLTSLIGSLPVADEERIIFNSLQGIVRGGVSELALDWLAESIVAMPDRKFFYEIQFLLHQALDQRDECRSVMEAWRAHSGEVDTSMVQALAQMQSEALEREQKRIQDALGGFNDE